MLPRLILGACLSGQITATSTETGVRLERCMLGFERCAVTLEACRAERDLLEEAPSGPNDPSSNPILVGAASGAVGIALGVLTTIWAIDQVD